MVRNTSTALSEAVGVLQLDTDAPEHIVYRFGMVRKPAFKESIGRLPLS